MDDDTKPVHVVTATDEISVSVSVRATASLRVNLAVQHMSAAARFSRSVGMIEAQNVGLAFGDFWEEVLHNSIAAIFACAASLEAYANELFFDRASVFPGYSSELLDKLWEAYEQKPTVEKFSFALTLREKQQFDRGKAPAQDVRAVLGLRNALTHFKPEWDNEAVRHGQIHDLLKGRFQPSPFLNDVLLFPRRWATHGATKWTVESCLAFAREFEGLGELSAKYIPGDNLARYSP